MGGRPLSQVVAARARSASCSQNPNHPLIEAGHRKIAPIRNTVLIIGNPGHLCSPAHVIDSPQLAHPTAIKKSASVGVNRFVGVIEGTQEDCLVILSWAVPRS